MANGKGWRWDPYIITLGFQALRFYAQQAGHHINGLTTFQGWPVSRAGGLRPYSTPLDTPRRTPMTTLFLFYKNNVYKNMSLKLLKN
jgi:hypothetical protein